jgi:hypothetical protein
MKRKELEAVDAVEDDALPELGAQA